MHRSHYDCRSLPYDVPPLLFDIPLDTNLYQQG